MLNFRFYNPTEVIFGKDTHKAVGKETKKYGIKVMLLYGSGHIKKTGLYDQIVAALKEENIDFIEFGGVQPNPRLEKAREGVALAKENGIDFILAVGGGSVIDSAKGIAMGALYDGDVWDFYIEKAVPKATLPVGVVVTIPAAGSETSKSSVLTEYEGGPKRPANFEIQRPKFAIMNPELTYSLPPYQTAAGATDIMAHAIERYFTQVRDVELTDRLCEAGLKTMISNVPMVLREPENYAARAEIMWSGSVIHNDLFSTGRIGDWGSHRIEHELSSINDIAHGAGLAIILPAWMKYVYKQGLERFVQYAVRVWNVEQDFFDPEKTALSGIARTKAFFASIGMPTSLAEAGFGEKDFDHIANNCLLADDGTLGSFVKLRPSDIRAILEIAK